MKRPSLTRLSLGLAVALGLCGCSGDDGDSPITQEPGQATCTFDAVDEPADATALAVDTSAEGYVCPVEDVDWYRLTVPDGDRIVQVSLAMSDRLSAIAPHYAIYTIDERGKPGEAVAAPPLTGIGATLDYEHCIGSGEYFVAVRDEGDDAQDVRHAYTLSVSSQADPDPAEPNDAADQAEPLADGTPTEGTIACRGDRDWYGFEVPAGVLLRVRLSTASPTAYEPTLKLRAPDDTVIALETNLSGSVEATEVDRYVVVPGAGRYHIEISDDDHLSADAEVPYTLQVDYIADADPNEPNNSAATATELSQSTISCSSGWSQPLETTGTIGAPGDNDWYKFALSGCSGGIVEAEMVFDTAGLSEAQKWEAAAEVQASLTLVRPHTDSPCDRDQTCNRLQIACGSDVTCAGYFESCMPDGLCAGASVCLPEGACGANQVQRRYACSPRIDECQPDSGAPAPPNRAVISAPILGGDDYLYLRASDFQANGALPDQTYTLRVRVRAEPDANEPSNLYMNDIGQPPSQGRHESFATAIPVHDCTAGDCCDGTSWVAGAIGYESDLDWYTYEHPCPGEDCTLRFHYEVDGGPVDTVMQIYRSGGPWFTAFEVDEAPSQAGVSGTMGGTSAQDRCFYAYQGHTDSGGEPYRYGVLVRDLFDLYSDGRTVRPDSRDWDPDQRYRLCVEKVAAGCSEPPCQLYDDGCGQPQQ